MRSWFLGTPRARADCDIIRHAKHEVQGSGASVQGDDGGAERDQDDVIVTGSFTLAGRSVIRETWAEGQLTN